MTTPQAGPGAVPVCPRHPDRVSYVRCQRCNRPACPECQRPAAVGIHCVDCVREAARTTPHPRTAFGAPLRRGPAVVTITLVVLNVLSYLLQRAVGAPWEGRLIFTPSIGESEPWRFLTTAFLHDPGVLFHILFNMIALWYVGQDLELALGRLRFTALYLLSAVGGSVMVLLLATPTAFGGDWDRGVYGASGAVFGLFGAVLVVLRRLGRNAQPIVVIIVLNLAIGFVLPQIAWQAHLGGLFVGAALGAAYAYAPAKRRGPVAVVATVGVAVLLVVLAAVKYALG